QVFNSSSPGLELDACLWSLTEVFKRLLKGAHQGKSKILGKLVAAFDLSLCALCSKFLSERKTLTQSLVDFTSGQHWRTTFCLLLDLLEVLTASSLMSGAGICLKSQRITHLYSSALLSTVSGTSDYFVKKRALLLLKRAVLQQAGEDWNLEVLSSGLKYEHFSSDMSTLAETVLTAVTANWLESVQVESASFFGGTRHITGYEGRKPDCVILRAVSLLLLKSVELHVQTAGAVDSASEVYGYLQRLWAFMRQCSIQLFESTHLCCCVSRVSGEQDDDMIEAAKALLSIFLHQRYNLSLTSVKSKTACASGCNPHCHFLFLLQSVSFDHSMLLDFLISTETCFLEYFVRYLKYLTVDWMGFTAACRTFSMSHSHPSVQETLTCSSHGDISALPYKGQPLVEKVSLIVRPHLVEYDSSEDSSQETMEISEDESGASVFDKGTLSALAMKQETTGPQISIKQRQLSDSRGLLSKSKSTLERQPQVLNMATLSGKVTCETYVKTVLCLSELREVLMRLQTKKLFPYKPSSLLKLLEQVQKCSQQSQLSRFNK
uniref:Lines homolog 1 n=1 Tax=Anabas testudineus TaxID=64144 RepID=A0A3Q1IBR8_ANATE